MRWLMKHVYIVILSAVLFLIPAAFGFAQDEQEGEATWHKTDSLSLHASHARLSLGTRVRVTNLEKPDKVVYVNITNRIPQNPDRILDLSEEAAKLLEMNETGRTKVRVEVVRGFSEEHFPPPEAEEVLAYEDEAETESAEGPEPALAAESAGGAVPEITAVAASDDGQAAPQPPVRTTVPPDGTSSQDVDWIVVKPAEAAPPPPPPPPPAFGRNESGAQTVSIRVVVNVDGQEHVVDIPDVASIPPQQRSSMPPAAKPSPSYAPPPPAGPSAKIVPKMPDPRGKGMYRVQVGAFSSTIFAQESYDRLKNAGFSPAFERHGNLYRVVITGIKASEMANVAQRLGSAGFSEAWVREEN